MQEKDVPLKWVDAAMTGASPGCRDDARFYLANAYETLREDLLWTLLEEDPQVTCACGRGWDVLVGQGPDFGHGRTECPASGDAVVEMNGTEYRLAQWRWTPLADWAGRTGRMALVGWWRWEHYDRDKGFYGRTRLDAVKLPGGQVCPTGQVVFVQMTAYGDDNGMFVHIEWDRETQPAS